MTDLHGTNPVFLHLPAAEPGRRLPVLLARAAVLVIAATALVVLSAFFDARVARLALALPPEEVAIGSDVSAIGRSGYMFAISGLLCVGCVLARHMGWLRQREAALAILGERAAYVFAALAASGIAAQLVKHLVGRARPKLMPMFGPYHFDLFAMKNSLASFPSGHTTTAFAMATALSLILPRFRLPLFVLATLIAASRVVVSAHFVSDIAAGAALGVLTSLAVTRAFASWSVAFDQEGSAIRLKGSGVVASALSGSSRAP